MARSGQRSTTRRGRGGNGGSGNGNRSPQRRHQHNEGLIPVLAKAVREVETAVARGSVTTVHTRYQAIALLVREERARVKADTEITDGQRGEELKRLDGIATILAKTAAQEPSFFDLLAEDAKISDGAKALRREMLQAAGREVPAETSSATAGAPDPLVDRRVVPPQVVARKLARPFLQPDYDAVKLLRRRSGRLAGWELLEPLFRSFEYAAAGASACMELPEPTRLSAGGGRELMRHQAQLVESVIEGHRSFLLADEPGLGKTAQALLAAEAADAYPLLVVVPNVVKTNWAREAGLWTPHHPVTVIHGNGDDVDGWADIYVVNYEILDRHVGWLGDLGFRGMVVDEAHFIKNKTSQRSQNVLLLSERLRERFPNPLLMALTGTPLINDIEDFRAIWQFLGWIDEKKPLPELMLALEDTGLDPADPSFYPAARAAVVDLGIVRRRKVDVAADIPARRVADLPVEIDDEAGRSIRDAERELARHLLERYDVALATRREGQVVEGIDHDLVRRVATWVREDGDDAGTGDNVFSMMRRIGQAKAELAADYAAQLARNVGKVVFFAKHLDVMDAAEAVFDKRGLRFSRIRGDQTSRTRQENIDAFVNDPEVAVIVCSLTAAGVGINLQVASNLVLAELSWTDAEQTQAIDRVHRIGQAEPVTAWRIIAAQTIDTRIAELIDAKAGLAARALDGAGESAATSVDVQLEALVTLLTDALVARGDGFAPGR